VRSHPAVGVPGFDAEPVSPTIADTMSAVVCNCAVVVAIAFLHIQEFESGWRPTLECAGSMT
jgi:hypothetical protein